jgi:hypothetical protein
MADEMMKRKWFLGVVLAAVPLVVACQDLSDYPYLFLTGYSERELVKMSRMSVHELEERIGLSEVPGGFYGKNAERGRAAHAIASYLGTRRWGPDITLAFGYLREYGHWFLYDNEADPIDLAANYAGIAYALQEAERHE